MINLVLKSSASSILVIEDIYAKKVVTYQMSAVIHSVRKFQMLSESEKNLGYEFGLILLTTNGIVKLLVMRELDAMFGYLHCLTDNNLASNPFLH